MSLCSLIRAIRNTALNNGRNTRIFRTRSIITTRDLSTNEDKETNFGFERVKEHEKAQKGYFHTEISLICLLILPCIK